MKYTRFVRIWAIRADQFDEATAAETQLMTFSWPRLSKVCSAWGLATLCACSAFVLYARSLPPDDLLMADTLGFQVMTSLLIVALPSVFCLFVFLGAGALVKGWLIALGVVSEVSRR